MRLIAFALLLTFSSAVPSSHAIEQADVFVSGQDGYHTYRIPAIIRARDGTLLAFCEGRKNSGADAGDIDLLVKRSRNGGRTWSAQEVLWDDGENTCGNPCPVVDAQTGAILLLSTHNLGGDHERDITAKKSIGARTVWLLRSDDNGATWTKPAEITSTTKDPSWGWYATGPGVGIQIQQGPHAGRLVIPSDHSYPPPEGEDGRGSHVIFSDDRGRTWQLGGTIRPQMNECQVVELFDDRGTLLMDMRSYAGRSRRAQSTSTDGGSTWTASRDVPELIEPVCQASILRWDRTPASGGGMLLFSNPADEKKRVKLTVRASRDNAKTWPTAHTLLLHEGPSAYSCLVALSDTEAACFYERGEKRPYEKITFARFGFADVVK